MDSRRNLLKWFKDGWHLAKPYWKSEEKYKALSLLAVIIVLKLSFVYMTVVANNWYNRFYDSIQNYQLDKFKSNIIDFIYIAFFYIAFQVLADYVRKFLEIRWRKWMTNYYLEEWLNNKSYYKSRFINDKIDNPDQRISEDIGAFISTALDLTLGLLTSVVSLASFVMILWKIGGVLKFDFMNHHFVIHGYMVWAALIYAVFGTWVMFKIGRPLIKLNFLQQAYEADFRYSLVRVREYSENIAFYNGERQESAGMHRRFNNVVGNFIQIIYRTMKMGVFSIGYAQAAVIFPILVSAPRYFTKAIKLGDLMQISSAFGRVLDAFSYFMDAYSSLANWRAIMDRLQGFSQANLAAKDLAGEEFKHDDQVLSAVNLTINLPNGRELVKGLSFSVKAGDRLLINGLSGSGKTTVFRTLAGLWHLYSGQINIPNQNSIFISQKPYIPLGTLKDAICYPKTSDEVDNSVVIDVMTKCQLTHLIDELNVETDWINKLSGGEQQRVAFCRIFINQAQIIYLDEATSALDEPTEAYMYELITHELKDSIIISVGHRSTIKKWHNQFIDLLAS